MEKRQRYGDDGKDAASMWTMPLQDAYKLEVIQSQQAPGLALWPGFVVRSQVELDALRLPHTHEYHCYTVCLHRSVYHGHGVIRATQTRRCTTNPCRLHQKSLTNVVRNARNQLCSRSDDETLRLNPIPSLVWLLVARHLLPETKVDEGRSGAADETDSPHVFITARCGKSYILNIRFRHVTPVMKQTRDECLRRRLLEWSVPLPTLPLAGYAHALVGILSPSTSAIAPPLTSLCDVRVTTEAKDTVMEKKGCGENSSPVEESKVVSMSSDSDRSSRTESLAFAASSAVPTAPAASPAVTVTTDTSSTVPVASSTAPVASSTAPAVPVATSGWEAASKRVIRSQEELDALALPHTHEYHCCTVLVRRCAMSGSWAFSAQQTRPCSHETPCRHHRRQITQAIAYTRRQFRADSTDNARVRLKPLHSLLWLLAVRHILPNTNDEASSTAGDADAPHVVIVVSPAAWCVLNICMRQLTPVMKQLLSNCLAQPALGKWFVQTSSSTGPSSLDETHSEIASPVTSTLLHSPLATLARMSAQVATPPRAAAAVPTSSLPYTSTGSNASLVPKECANDIVDGSSVAVEEQYRFTENAAPPREPSLSWNVACTNDLS